MLVARCARMLAVPKSSALVLTQKVPQIHGNTVELLPAASMCLLDSKNVRTTPTSSQQHTSVVANVPQVGYFERLLLKYKILDVQKYRYMMLGYIAYEHVISQIDYTFFYKYFNMPDTLVSWFLVTELHVWMIMVRYMAEGKNGQLVRNNVVAAMWEDTKARVDNLGTITTKIKNNQIKELYHQFNAAIIGYDEGIQSEDQVLAGALWRRFFCLECNNPEHIETLVIYVRKQICLFDSLTSQEIFKLRHPGLKLMDLKSLCKPQ